MSRLYYYTIDNNIFNKHFCRLLNGCSTPSNPVFFIFNTRELLVNRKDLRASTLVGLNRESQAIDPLAVQHLNNPLYMLTLQSIFITFI